MVQGPATQVPAGQNPQEQETVQSGTVQDSQQMPSFGRGTRRQCARASSKKREAIDKEDGPGRPAKRQKSEQESEYSSPAARTVEFRPANRTPPTEEDLELTKWVQKAKTEAGVEECVESEDDIGHDPSSPQANVSRRVSELRGGGTKRSSRSRHEDKVARKGEHRLRSGLSREWSMDS